MGGDYVHCNHTAGSTAYHCKCPKSNASCDMHRPGKEKSAHGNGNTWYSFPKLGLHKHWDYDTGSGCHAVNVQASCVIDHLANKAGCPGKCNATNAKECAACVHKLSDADQHFIFDEAIFDKKCPEINASAAVIV